jgi:DNA-binding response OmpR family regulator
MYHITIRLPKDRERPGVLTRSEFELLWAVAAKKGGVAPYWHCMNATGSEAEDEHAVSVILVRVRKKLGVPGLVQTVRSEGYRLNVWSPVRQAPSGAVPAEVH